MSPLSADPADRLIRNLIDHHRQPTEPEIKQIAERLHTADFDTRIVRVPEPLRGLGVGLMLHELSESVTYHYIRRVAGERQWVDATTPEQFLTDLRTAVTGSATKIALFWARGGAIALVVASTAEVVPAERRGENTMPLLVVVYSADRGVIISGYQASSMDTIRIGERPLWLP